MKGETSKRKMLLMGGVLNVTIALMLVLLVSIAIQPAALHADDWVEGDVFVGVGNGTYSVYDNSGVFKENTSESLGDFTTGCAFNPDIDKLYTTNFTARQVVVLNDAHPHTIAQAINTIFRLLVSPFILISSFYTPPFIAFVFFIVTLIHRPFAFNRKLIRRVDENFYEERFYVISATVQRNSGLVYGQQYKSCIGFV